MQKIKIQVALFLVVFFSLQMNAKAGLAFFSSGAVSVSNNWRATEIAYDGPGGGVRLATFVIGIVFTTTGAILLLTTLNPNNAGIQGVLIILPADGLIPTNHLAELLQKKYPFIDDQEILFDLASLVKTKAEKIPFDGKGKKMVSLTSEEITNIFASSDYETIFPSEYAQLVSDLL